MTKQRTLILDLVTGDKCHHTADEILALARERLPGISRATVYNNLHVLERERLIRRITGEDSADRYDGSYVPHGLMFCTECHGVTDFDTPQLMKTLSKMTGVEIDSYELKIRYVCDDCRQKTNV